MKLVIEFDTDDLVFDDVDTEKVQSLLKRRIKEAAFDLEAAVRRKSRILEGQAEMFFDDDLFDYIDKLKI